MNASAMNSEHADKLPESLDAGQSMHHDHAPPLRHGQEWANALTHGIGTAGSLVAGVYLILLTGNQTAGLLAGCAVYVAAMSGTYLFSTLSHVVRRQPLLNTMRAWDQAMIYTMIAGTYTPLTIRFATEPTRTALLVAMWSAAAVGFWSKVGVKHRVNASGTISYLLLGYLPGFVLASHVPTSIAVWMVVGGLVYTVGVLFLIYDHHRRYNHAAWHLMVIVASVCHFIGMVQVVA